MIGQYTLQQWILYFYVYCFLGWIFESCYVSFRKKEWVNEASFMVLFSLFMAVGQS